MSRRAPGAAAWAGLAGAVGGRGGASRRGRSGPHGAIAGGRRPRRHAVAAVLAAVAALGAGCGLGPGERRPGGGAELRVTRDFGQTRLGAHRVPRVRRGQTVMSLLQSRHRVETRDPGGSVESIDGLGREGPGGRWAWSSFVNGIEAGVGAAALRLSPGDVVQWDYHRRDAAQRVPAIVGAYPEPFVHGTEGKRRPVRVECDDDRSAACREARRRLATVGVPVTIARLGAAAGAETVRVVVAPWASARRVGAVAALSEGPAQSGVFARFSSDGRRLELLDPDGRPARAAPAGAGLVAALARRGEALVWAVTGADRAGVEAAARTLDARALRDAFAVAATPAGPVPLPVQAQGAR